MKKIKIITIILAIILITMIAFGGLYIKTQNRMEDKIKEYTLGRELKGGRVIELKVNTANESSEQDKEKLTVENYEIVKKTIENRLNNLAVEDYTISLNKEDGTIRVELAENENTDTYVYFLTASGEVQIKEKDAETVLLSDSMVEKAVYTYTSDIEGAYEVYIELQLTNEGQAKIAEIKENYAVFANEIDEIEKAKEKENADNEGNKAVEEENTTTDEQTNAAEEKTEEEKKIAVLTIAGKEYDINKIEKNKVRVSIGGKTTNTVSVNNNIAAAAEIAMLIDSGKYPVQYEIGDNRYVATDITEKYITYLVIAIIIAVLVLFVMLVIKYKTKGLLACISYVGFISILLLVLRYTNVSISIEGVGALILVLIINFRINQILLEKTSTYNVAKEAIISTYKEVFSRLIPVIIITLVFCFARWANLSSFGMIMFWGLLLTAIYNILITETLLKLKESK